MVLLTNIMSLGKNVVIGWNKTRNVRFSKTSSNVVRNHSKQMKTSRLMYGRKDRLLESFIPGAIQPLPMLLEQFVVEL